MEGAETTVINNGGANGMEEEGTPPVKRSRGLRKNWRFEKKLDHAKEALAVVKAENHWAFRDRYDTPEGTKVVYRCNEVRWKGKQCPAAVYLLYHATTDCVSLYRTDGENHDHSDNTPSRGLPAELRPLVEEKVEDGTTAPTMLARAITRHSLPVPPISQLRNYVQHYKRTRYGPATMTVGQFDRWCAEHAEPDPTNPDKAYVLKHFWKVDDSGNATIRAFISTPRLLTVASASSIVHADATYKLESGRRPTIVVGTSDRNRQFHPAGLAVTSGETSVDYAFAFQTMADGIRTNAGFYFQPQFLVADAAPAITLGFQTVFGDGFKRIVCWAHVIRTIDDRLKKISNADGVRDKIRADISDLQRCHSEAIFDAVVDLFIQKWRD